MLYLQLVVSIVTTFFYIYVVAESNTTDSGVYESANLSATSQPDYDMNYAYDHRMQKAVQPRLATPCYTPNQDEGYCLEIHKCVKLFNQLNNENATQFLDASRCGPRNEDSSQPKYCCGKFDNFEYLVIKKSPLPKSCGRQNVTLANRIFGGQQAEVGEFPWLVRLIHRNRYGSRTVGCSAFLIHSKFVLTAAHCLQSDFVDAVGNVFEVQLGAHETNCSENNKCPEGPKVIQVKERIVHGKYVNTSNQHHHDIGLIYLKKGAKLSKLIQPICLSNIELNVSEYWISGWGQTETGSTSAVKLKVDVPKVSREKCRAKFETIRMKILRTQICAGGVLNKDSCAGDSGGPLMALWNNQWFASGVTSYGFGCGKEGWPGVYSNIANYKTWIETKIIDRKSSNARSRGRNLKN